MVRRSLSVAFRLTGWVGWLIASVFTLTSFFAYSTAGFDTEFPSGDGITVRYSRIRWDIGSTWVGVAEQPVPHPGRELESLDPGGTPFARPTPVAGRTWWERRGFWLIQSPADDPYVFHRYLGATRSAWVGVPSWLVFACLWARTLRRIVVRS